MQQAVRTRILRVLVEPAAEAALPLPPMPAGWLREETALADADPDAAGADLLLLALDPRAAGLAVWLARFRLQHPHCQVLLADPGAEPAWYRAAVELGVDGLLPLPATAADWLGRLAASAEALGAAETQRRLLGELERGSHSLAESRRQLAGQLLQSYEHLGRVHRELERRLEQLSVLYRLGRDLGREQNWDQALAEFLKSCVDHLDFEGVALLLWSFDGRRLAVRAERALAGDGLLRALRRLSALPGEGRRESGVLALTGERELLAGPALREGLAEAELFALPLAMGEEEEGFLVFRKGYASAAELDADFHFLKTVQTLLGEAIGGAKVLHRLRRLDAFNRSVLGSVHAAVLTVDGEGLVSYRNPRAAALFGERLAPGTAFAFDAGFHLLGAEPLAPGGLGETDWIQRECRLLDGGGERRLLLSVTCLSPRHSSEVRHVLVGEDLTDYKRLEAELRQAERLSSLGQLSAGMAHEIRNPLAGIAMTAQVLKSRLGDRPDADPYLERIQAEIQRLERIVRSLLAFSRPARPQLAPLDLAGSARRVLEDLAGQAAAAGIALEGPGAEEACLALADRDQLHQVLLNLVQNALQACRPGDRVGIRLERAAVVGGTGRLLVRVWDSGPGVPAGAEARLFEPFFTTKAEGTGLGLAVCRQILEEHGGRISYRPHRGGGAEFTLELAPAAAPPRSEESRA